ncbi:MAG: hypothetical protein ABI624_18870 [Casimicrobiaceae bacterium]
MTSLQERSIFGGMKLILAAVVMALGTLLGGCGNPSGKPAFEFTPFPYTMEPGPGGTPIAVADFQGSEIIADEIGLLVRRENLAAFLEGIGALGFQAVYVGEDDPVIINLRVPPGSPVAALDAVRPIEGVIAASLNGIAHGNTKR